jgi:hypothetical protein
MDGRIQAVHRVGGSDGFGAYGVIFFIPQEKGNFCTAYIGTQI